MKMIHPKHAASGSRTPVETKKERALRLPGRWEQFRPTGPHGEDLPARQQRDDEARGQGAHGVRRHSLTVVFQAR